MKTRFLNSLIFTFLCLCLVNQSQSTLLVPDANTNILVMFPENAFAGAQFTIFFQFDPNSSTITYGNVFGLVFPKTPTSIGSTDLNSNNVISWSCALTNGSVNYVMVPVMSTQTSDNNVAFCQFQDITTLSLLPSVTYKLSFKFNTATFSSTKFLRNIGLYTATSQNANRVFIDTLSVVDSVGLLNDYTAQKTPGLYVMSTAVTVTSGPSANTSSTVIYPYNIFSVTFNLQCNTYIPAESLFLFQYSTTFIKNPSQIITGSLSSNPQNPLGGNLVLNQFAPGTVNISGVNESLRPGRYFSLTLSGIQANALPTTGGSILLTVMYKNTYTILSYSNVGSAYTISVIPLTVNNVNHIESFEVYAPMAWPYTFSVSTSSALNSGFIVIQQTNTNDTNNKMTFIASTCDFSTNGSTTDTTFAGQSKCFPLRSDTNYSNTSSSTGYSGSGIFFRMPSMTAGSSITVNIWIMADVCGANYYSSTLNSNTPTPATFGFTAYYYATIDTSLQNESRFSTANMIGISSQVLMSNSCLNGLRGDGSPSLSHFVDSLYQLELATGNVPNPQLLLGEYYNFDAISNTQTAYCGVGSGTLCTTSYYSQPTLAGGTSNFLFSSGNKLSSGSFIHLRIPFKSTVGEYIRSYIPSNSYGHNNFPGVIFTYPGRLWFQFSKAWFLVGDTKSASGNNIPCVVSWVINNATGDTSVVSPTAANAPNAAFFFGYGVGVPSAVFTFDSGAHVPNNGKQLDSMGPSRYLAIYQQSLAAYASTASLQFNQGWFQNPIATDVYAISSNWIIEGDLNGIENTLTKLPVSGTYSGIYQIVSVYEPTAATSFNSAALGSTTTKFAWVSPFNNYFATNVAQQNYFLLTTTCLKWLTTTSTLTSIYTALDIQAKWRWTSSSSTSATFYTIRVLRLIKFFPEIGVFQDNNSGALTPSTLGTLAIYQHIGFGNFNTVSQVNGICLTSIDKTQANSQSTYSVLAVFLIDVVLFETDYNNTAATYPVAPLNSLSAYSRSSSFLHSTSVYNNLFNNSFLGLVQGIKDNVSAAGAGTVNLLTSAYYFLAPAVYVTGNSTGNVTGASSSTTNNLLIPHYCPDFNTLKNNQPSVISMWLSGTSWSTWTKSGPYVGSATNQILFVSGLKNPGNNITVATQNTVWVKFPSYSSSISNTVYVYNTSASTNCSGYSFLLSANVAWDTTTTVAIANIGSSSNLGSGTTSGQFYAFGRPFNKVVLSENRTTSTAVSIPAASMTTTLTGVIRPALTVFVDSNNFFNIQDQIGFGCASSLATDSAILSNLLSTATFNAFPTNIDSVTTNWTSVSLTAEIGTQYLNDYAGSMKMTFILPSTMPQGSFISFSTGTTGFNTNSICGVSQSGPLQAALCTPTNSNFTSWSCPINSTTASLYICCYNITLSSTNVALSSITASYNLKSQYSASYFNPVAFSGQTSGTTSTPNPFTWTANNASNNNLITNLKAKVSQMVFLNTNQQGGLVVAMFVVTLPRPVLRYATISITGDFTVFMNGSLNPACTASFSSSGVFGNSWDSGDSVLDICNISTLNTTNGSIQVSTKRIPYKCGTGLNNTLTIYVWPLLGAVSTKTYTISMQLRDSNYDTINAASLSLPVINNLDPAPTSTFQAGLCNVSNIYPMIVGEYADYTFNFDFTTNASALSSGAANEVTIIFPFNIYQELNQNTIGCFYNGQMGICTITNGNIVNAIFTTLTSSQGSAVLIKLIGIKNPESTTDLNFICSINNYTLSNKRINQLIGSGKLTGGINDVATDSNKGNLMLINDFFNISQSNPRYSFTLNFKIGFDYTINSSNVPNGTTSSVVLSNNPVLSVVLPNSFNLAWYANSYTVALIEYSLDNNSNDTQSATPSTTFTTSGNRIDIALGTSYSIPVAFRFWTVSIGNIPAPIDSMNSFGMVRAFLFSSTYSYLYKSFSNLHTHSINPITLTSVIDLYYTNFRGIALSFDNTKWVVDVSGGIVPNRITIYPGYYNTYNFSVRSTPGTTIIPAVTNISINIQGNSAIFQLFDNSYSVNSSQLIFPFLIGAPCLSYNGRYILYFSSSNTTQFVPMAPVIVTVSNTNPGQISCSMSTIVPVGTNYDGYCSTNVIPFEQVSLTFSATSGASTVSTIASVNINARLSAAQFTLITQISYDQNGVPQNPSQSISVISSNTCFINNPSNPNVLFSTSGNTMTITNQDITTWFMFNNADADTSLNTMKNGLKFYVTAPVFPVNLYCAFLCSDQTVYPSDTTIMQAANLSVNSSPLISYYNTYINSSTQINFTVGNLVRGQRYGARCIVTTTETNISNRSNVSATFSVMAQSPSSKSLITGPIMMNVTQTVQTQCAVFLFNSPQATTTLNQFLYQCQYTFDALGGINSGCVMCQDLAAFMNPGLSFSQNTTCYIPNNITSNSIYNGTYIAPPLVTTNTSTAVQPTTTTTANTTNTNTTNTNTTNTNTTNTNTSSTSGTSGSSTATTNNSTSNSSTSTSGSSTNSTSTNGTRLRYLSEFHHNRILSGNSTTISTGNGYSYTLCAVQDLLCSTDIQGSTQFATMFQTYTLTLRNAASVQTTLNLPNVAVVNVTITNDMTPPLPSFITFQPGAYSTKGLFSIPASSTWPMRCYWALSLSSQGVMANDIRYCSDPYWCGTFDINGATTLQGNAQFAKPFNPGSSYIINLVCYNQVIGATLASPIINAYNFTVPIMANNMNIPCPDPIANRTITGVCYCPLAGNEEFQVVNNVTGDCETAMQALLQASLDAKSFSISIFLLLALSVILFL